MRQDSHASPSPLGPAHRVIPRWCRKSLQAYFSSENRPASEGLDERGPTAIYSSVNPVSRGLRSGTKFGRLATSLKKAHRALCVSTRVETGYFRENDSPLHRREGKLHARANCASASDFPPITFANEPRRSCVSRAKLLRRAGRVVGLNTSGDETRPGQGLAPEEAPGKNKRRRKGNRKLVFTRRRKSVSRAARTQIREARPIGRRRRSRSRAGSIPVR